MTFLQEKRYDISRSEGSMKPDRLRFAAALAAAMVTTSSPAKAGDVIPPQVYTMTPTGVNVSDGSFTYTVTDLSIGTLSLERFYLSSSSAPIDPDNMFFGLHTSNNFDIFVTPGFQRRYVGPPSIPEHPKPIVHLGMSASGLYHQEETFPDDTSLQRQSLDAAKGSLAYQGGTYTYTDHSGTSYRFNSAVQVAGALGMGGYAPHSQRIGSITYPNGRVRSFSYDSYTTPRLKMVSDSTGYAIIFDYADPSNPTLPTAACGFNLSQTYITTSSTCSTAALKVAYTYSGGLLRSVTDVLGQVTNYTYAALYGQTYLNCIAPPGYTPPSCQLKNEYLTTQSLRQTLADGSQWTMGWMPTIGRDTDYVPADGDNQTSVTDPAGKTSIYVFTGTSPYSATDPLGRMTTYRYTGGQDQEQFLPPMAFGSTLVSAQLPEGNAYVAENVGPFQAITKETWKAKPGSGLPDQIKTYGYTYSGTLQNMAKPIWVKDPNGNQTDYSYASWGGTLSEMQPAPSTGSARPLKLYTYVQKYAYIKNAGGTLVPAAAPLWLPASETDCQTVAGGSTLTCDAAAPQVATTYEYGANGTADNLFPRGKVVTSGGVALRSCYGYDHSGNRISETAPRAGLASCP